MLGLKRTQGDKENYKNKEDANVRYEDNVIPVRTCINQNV